MKLGCVSMCLPGYAPPVCPVNLACCFWELLGALQPCGNAGSFCHAQITIAEAVVMAESTCFVLGDESRSMQVGRVPWLTVIGMRF